MVSNAEYPGIIELIRHSDTPADAKAKLVARGWELGNVAGMLEKAGDDAARPEWLEPEFGIREGQYFLTEQQAQAILDLRLHKLTGLEHEKILEEYQSLLDLIAELLFILASPERLMEVIRDELLAVREQYGDERRTEINASSAEINIEDLITPEDVVVTLSHQGYVKYQPLTDYEAQRRGGRGKSATRIKEEDFVERLLVANTHDTILCFSTRGKVYWLKVYQLPEASRSARGRPIINLLPLEEGERITAILPVKEYADDKYVFFATADGTVKKTSLSAFSRPLSSGIRAINLKEGDELIGVDITDGSNEIMLFSDAGKVVRFAEGSGRVDAADTDVSDDVDGDDESVIDAGNDDDGSDGTESKGTFKGVRPMGRTAGGVRGIRLLNGDKVVSLIVPRGEGAILTATENGYGKRTALTEYPTKSRGTQGVRSIKVDERNGKVIDAIQVEDTDQIMLITNGGTLVRTRVAEVSIIGRNTGGVRLIRTGEDETVVGLQRIAESDEEEHEVLMDGELAEAGLAPADDVASESGDAQQNDQAEQADEE